MHRLLLSALLVLPLPALQAASSFTVTLLDQRGQPIPDAVVSLTPLDPDLPRPAPTPATTPATTIEIEQIDQQYQPYVTPVQIGTEIHFPNRDSIQHHLYSVSRAKRFEKPLYGSGETESIVFDQPGVVVLGCNIHDWMVAYVVVLNTPWYGLSTTPGTVTLADLPPGRYQLDVWHPRLPRNHTAEVTLAADTAVSETLTLRPDRRLRRAPTPDRPGAY